MPWNRPAGASDSLDRRRTRSRHETAGWSSLTSTLGLTVIRHCQRRRGQIATNIETGTFISASRGPMNARTGFERALIHRCRGGYILKRGTSGIEYDDLIVRGASRYFARDNLPEFGMYLLGPH